MALPQGDGDDEIQAAAQAVVDGCKLLHAARVPEVQRLLAAALERRRQQPAAAAPRAPGEAPDAPVPAKQAATPLPDDSEGDQAPLHREQQRYLQAAAARATRMLAAAAATASLDRLGEYLVRGRAVEQW